MLPSLVLVTPSMREILVLVMTSLYNRPFDRTFNFSYQTICKMSHCWRPGFFEVVWPTYYILVKHAKCLKVSVVLQNWVLKRKFILVLLNSSINNIEVVIYYHCYRRLRGQYLVSTRQGYFFARIVHTTGPVQSRLQ